MNAGGDNPEQIAVLEGPLRLPAIIFGAGSFSNSYNTDDHLYSDTPRETVRLALQYGICAFDTSVYYGPSEVVLGNALKALEEEFPRSHYQLMTKCGRYGLLDFDYSPTRIRSSVENSLRRLQTDYLDTVYLHDIEFVCTPVTPRKSGNHMAALADEKVKYGLAEGDEGRIRGDGDQKVLDAFAELRKLKEEGKVKHIGITGYPLPTLLRLALLILHTSPYQPVDVILSYSHLSLQNATFSHFAPLLREHAKVGQLLTASPMSMGLFSAVPPPWHPAPPELKAIVAQLLDVWPNKLPNLALGYAFRNTGATHDNIPLVVGFSQPEEVRESVKVWWELQRGLGNDDRGKVEEEVRITFRNKGFLDWSWASP